jgi:hypothetical protein
MGTLKTTLKVESTDLFPTPVSFTNVNNNGVNGNFNGFNTLTCSTAYAQLNTTTIDGTGCYLYLQSPSTNVRDIAVGYTGQAPLATATGTLIYLSPGDVAFVPVGVGATAANIGAFTPSGSATLYFFIGEK